MHKDMAAPLMHQLANERKTAIICQNSTLVYSVLSLSHAIIFLESKPKKVCFLATEPFFPLTL